jgi:hypothetical protein
MPVATMETQVESSESLLAPTDTPYPTYTPQSTYTPQPTDTPPLTATAPVIMTGTATVTASPREPTTTATPTASPAAPQKGTVPTRPTAQASAGQAVELTRIADTDPGPPLTIQVSAIRIKENGYYKLTGVVRNDSADESNPGEIYGGIGVIATFFTDVPPPNYHGPVEVYAPCPLLAPGAECPFSLEIYPRDYVAYHLHPEGAPVEYHQPASLALSGLNIYLFCY